MELDGAILDPTWLCVRDVAIALVLAYPAPAGNSSPGLSLRSRNPDRRQVDGANAAAERTEWAGAGEVAVEQSQVSGKGRLGEGARKIRMHIRTHLLLDSVGNRPGANGLRWDCGRV
jgi:hypothetical protein